MRTGGIFLKSVISALKKVSGQKAELFRREFDGNLQPVGNRKKVGEGFGAFVNSKGGHSGIKIEIPGIIVDENTDNSFNFVSLCGEKPKKEDFIKFNETSYKVLSVSINAFVYRLKLKEEL